MSDANISIACPACRQTIQVPGSWQGKRRPCPQCHEWIQIPAAAGGGSPAAPGPAAPAAGTPAPAAPANVDESKLSFAERMKLAAERGSTAIRQKEEVRARREAARAKAPTFEEKMRVATTGATSHRSPPPAAADSLAPATLPPMKPAALVPAAGGTAGASDWSRGSAPSVDAAEAERLRERDQRLAEQAYAPEKIGRIAVILCAISLSVFLLSMLVTCMGGLWAFGGGGGAAVAGGGGPTGAHSISFFGGATMSFGICMFGFSPICALCGFFLGLHSLLHSRHTRVWGVLGTVLNGLLVVPPLIICIVVMAGI